jgi:hypothetical protein
VLTWVCGAVARWVGELFSRVLSRASSLAMACCKSCTTGGVREHQSEGRGQEWDPTRQAQGLTASQVLVLHFQAGDPYNELTVISARPTGGPRA